MVTVAFMGYPRHSQISLKETPYYHCVARCVRRGWLYGYDKYAGKDFSHRKQWIIDRLTKLSMLFAIDVCAYAVMSNHYHLGVFVDVQRAQSWTELEVVRRWTQLYKLPELVRRYLATEVSLAEQDAAKLIIDTWRKRLMDVSWFMKEMNEHLARKANAEDGCTGRFWEGRFKCQALLDEAAILTAMAYVDLNPIRAGIAATPEESQFTSIHQRIQILHGKSPAGPQLRRFHEAGNKRDSIPFSLKDYIQLVDWTGRCIRGDKRGAIDNSLPPILQRLNIDQAAWIVTMQIKGNIFGRAMGKLDHLRIHAKALGQSWIKGLRQAERMYRSI
jgi:REP element-mobilizing transposase RayT